MLIRCWEIFRTGSLMIRCREIYRSLVSIALEGLEYLAVHNKLTARGAVKDVTKARDSSPFEAAYQRVEND